MQHSEHTVSNRILHRRSAVTQHSDFEPHVAVQPVYAHEALWLDSGDIPTELKGDMTSLFVQEGEYVFADTRDANAAFDRDGVKTDSGVIKKRVRLPLHRRRYGEYTLDETLHIVHANFAIGTAAIYQPFIEVFEGDAYKYVYDHLVCVDYASGVITVADLPEDAVLSMSFYEYVGRVGPTAMMLSPNTDHIAEGSVNKFMTQAPVRDWFDQFAVNVGGPIRNVSDIQLQGSGNNTLSVRNVGGDPTLMFGSTNLSTPNQASAETSGCYTGTFEGAFYGTSRGTHVGNVTGDVVGTVSSLANHDIIHADLVGNGKGDWTGAVHGTLTGVFEGELAVSAGTIDGVDHVAVGCVSDGTSALRIACPSGPHLRLVSDTQHADLSCDADGYLRTSRLATTALEVTGSTITHGIDNMYSGIRHAGDVTGVRYMHVKTLECDEFKHGDRIGAGVLYHYARDVIFQRTEVFVSAMLSGVLGDARYASSIRVPCARGQVVRVSSGKLQLEFDSAGERCVEVDTDGVRLYDDVGERSITWNH